MEHPFPHVIIRDFLPATQTKRLENALRKQKFTRKDADLFSFAQTADLLASKDREIQSFLRLLKSKEFTTQANKLLRKKTTPGKIDASAFIYTDGDYLLCHDDGISSRRIAYIYNLSDFTAKDGGALCLFDAKNHWPSRVVKRITPHNNTLVLFAVTKDSHHMVEEVLSKKERLTIAGWLHA